MSFRILVVDDSPVARKVVRRALNMTGLALAEVHEAAGGLEALEALRRAWIDLVVTDVHMPEMNGQELVEAMRGDPALADIPVIVVSSDTTEARRDALLAAGARDYIVKPITPERLRAAAMSALYPEAPDAR
jgi:two-component system chemotaxis response regulator CheY